MIDWQAIAEKAYEAYGNTVGWKNFAGQAMPPFKDLPPTIQTAWEAACRAITRDASARGLTPSVPAD
jgi:hypothetical protein